MDQATASGSERKTDAASSRTPPTGRLARPKNMFFINTPVKDGIRKKQAKIHSDEDDSASSYSPTAPTAAKSPSSIRVRSTGFGPSTNRSSSLRSHPEERHGAKGNTANADKGDHYDDDEDDDDDDDDSSAWGSAYTSSAASSVKEKNLFPKVPTRSSTHLPSLVEVQTQDDGMGKPGLLSNLFRTASHRTLKRTQTAPLSRPLSRQVSPTQTLSNNGTASRFTQGSRHRPSSKSHVDVPLAFATLAAPSASISTSNIMSTSHGGSKQTATEMMRSQRSTSSRDEAPKLPQQARLNRINTFTGPLSRENAPVTTIPGPTAAEHSSALNAVRSMARTKKSFIVGDSPEGDGKASSSAIPNRDDDEEDENEAEDDSEEEEDDAFVAPILTPRTTRKLMLATELSESVRRNLIWERQQRVSLPKLVTPTSTSEVKPSTRRSTAPDMSFRIRSLAIDDKSGDLPNTKSLLGIRSMENEQAIMISNDDCIPQEGALDSSSELVKAKSRQEQFRAYFMEDPGYHAVGW